MKRRLVLGMLAALLAWVPVHRWLVLRLDLNPWKFGGLAMYAAPAPKIGIGFYSTTGDGVLAPLEIPSRAEDQPLFLDFFARRRHAGMLVRPDALAARIFALDPSLQDLAIVITRRSLDAETARVVARRRGYRYRRDGG